MLSVVATHLGARSEFGTKPGTPCITKKVTGKSIAKMDTRHTCGLAIRHVGYLGGYRRGNAAGTTGFSAFDSFLHLDFLGLLNQAEKRMHFDFITGLYAITFSRQHNQTIGKTH